MKLKIAVIGAGVAGITSAYLLQRQHDVTLFDKNDYIGGHTNTIIIDKGPDAGTPVDTGFIVLNDRTYPNFNTLLRQLDVPIAKTDMSFSFYCCRTGQHYASTDINRLFARRRNLFYASYWAFLLEVIRFCRLTRRRYYQHRLNDLTMAEFLEREHISDDAAKQFVIPMASAIWSAPSKTILNFPMQTFARFYENHGLLSFTDQPQWYYIPGGSRKYVEAFLKRFNGQVCIRTKIAGLRRLDSGAVIKFLDGNEKRFDRIVIATHADQACRLITDPSPDESRLLSVWNYTKNHTILHTDISQLPPHERIWASWNYIREERNKDGTNMTVTYDMRHLQQLKTECQYCVTLNPVRPIPRHHIIKKITYTHPVYTFESIATQKELPLLNGRRNTFFCGSYFGYGFHEDAVTSAIAVAKQFGIEL